MGWPKASGDRDPVGVFSLEADMHNTIAPKSKRIVLVVKTPTVGTGHRSHRGGSGKHGDRRLKRQGTRQTRFQESIKE
jgi:hypothetical protein